MANGSLDDAVTETLFGDLVNEASSELSSSMASDAVSEGLADVIAESIYLRDLVTLVSGSA